MVLSKDDCIAFLSFLGEFLMVRRINPILTYLIEGVVDPFISNS